MEAWIIHLKKKSKKIFNFATKFFFFSIHIKWRLSPLGAWGIPPKKSSSLILHNLGKTGFYCLQKKLAGKNNGFSIIQSLSRAERAKNFEFFSLGNVNR